MYMCYISPFKNILIVKWFTEFQHQCLNGQFFYPTALKGCRGIVFTHGVRMDGRRETVCPACISETV